MQDGSLATAIEIERRDLAISRLAGAGGVKVTPDDLIAYVDELPLETQVEIARHLLYQPDIAPVVREMLARKAKGP